VGWEGRVEISCFLKNLDFGVELRELKRIATTPLSGIQLGGGVVMVEGRRGEGW
jgi:hypothetical protein